MPERYRYTLPSGRVAETVGTPASIRKAHPRATITHRIVTDERGQFVSMEPFRGKSAEPAAEVAAEVAAAPAKTIVKAGGKKQG